MYRALLILAILNFVEPHHWCPNHPTICQRHHHDYKRRYHGGHGDERFFDHLANDIIEADNKVKNFCAQNQGITTKEIYDQDNYKLIISLPNYNESTIELKIKHRVLYIKAERTNEYKKYVNVKILPELLSTTAAKWHYANQELTMAVPYKMDINSEADTGCGDDINNVVFDVPKANYDLNEAPQIDVRLTTDTGNGNITENVV